MVDSQHTDVYEDHAVKFLQHFKAISDDMNKNSGITVNFLNIGAAWVAQELERWPTGVSEFEPRLKRNLLTHKRGSIAHSLSFSSAHRPDMTDILLQRP